VWARVPRRPDGPEPPLVDDDIGLAPPDRHQDRSRYAEPLLDAAEQRRLPAQQARALLQPIRRHHAPGELLETLPEHALRMVARDDAGIEAHAAERRSDGALRDSPCGSLALETLEPAL